MKNLRRIVQLFRPYKLALGMNLLFNACSIVFSLFSLTLIAPFLGVLFGKIDPVNELPVFDGNLFQLGDAAINYFYYQLGQLIEQEGQMGGLLFICAIVLVAFLLKNLFRYLALYFLAPIRNGVIYDIRSQLFAKLNSLPLGYYSDKQRGDIIARNTVDVQEVEWGVLGVIELLFKEPLTILLYLGAMLVISPKLSIVVFLVLPIAGVVIGGLGKSLRKVSERVMEQLGELLGMVEESIGGLKIIKAFGAENQQAAEFDLKNNEQRSLMNSMMRKRYLASPLSEFLGICVVVVVLYIGGKMVLAEGATFSAELFITFMVIFSQIINPAKAFTSAWYHIIKGMASLSRIDGFMAEQSENYLSLFTGTGLSRKEAVSGSASDSLHGVSLHGVSFTEKIVFENVFFSYEDQPVLKEINLEINKGELVALVGQSGAGKTTLADLIPRFYECKEGRISMDGRSLADWPLEHLRAQVGIVTQEPILFHTSIRNNLLMAAPNATEAQLKEACAIANATDFIAALPDGLATEIGDRGNKLSGGERQRLTIARAILKDPAILILDEATSSLDAASELLVRDAMAALMKGRTSIVIAHRLSTIRAADKIVVMQEGRIVEQGAHDFLIQKAGAYSSLVELQSL